MSIDLVLFCKKSLTQSEIEAVIKPLGFRIQKEWSSEKYNRYLWFEEKDWASLRGCWLSWYEEWKGEAPRGTLTVFMATTYAGRSHEDLDMQNKVIRELRRRFGGSVYDPQENAYRYLRNDIPKLSDAEKRCGLIYGNIKNIIAMVKLMPHEIPEKSTPVVAEDLGLLIFEDSITHNNLLLPFLVSCLETFLRDFFVAYVESQPRALERIYEGGGKLEYAVLRDLLEGRISLAEHEASKFSFQNLKSANVAFQKYTEVDLLSIWSRRKKFNGKIYRVTEVLQELLDLRHRIVHEAYIKPDLGANEATRYIIFVEHAVDFLIQYLEKKKNFRIDLEKHI